ncbi:hypothetical protein [Micromonospora sp. RL09-050-HVF-A]|uniref:hypothetical protein n=1 Tax=Micromonospora sp. RL09-050-HVF-A TaxID=1703433 RepID=UPI001C6072E9|nr:hypothetical protein [Micromonospora sp. RL09-050-HVF-A]MBW4704080.1 hypothetical protein [Micromonospora sp. RL09-050-HVF-A]
MGVGWGVGVGWDGALGADVRRIGRGVAAGTARRWTGPVVAGAGAVAGGAGAVAGGRAG